MRSTQKRWQWAHRLLALASTSMVIASVVTIDGAALAAGGPGGGGGGGGGNTTTTTLAVTSVTPNTGTAAGGQRVTVNGTGLAAGATVVFGTAPATNVSCTTSSCTVTTPAGADPVDVRVTVGTQTSAVNSKDRFFFVPQITGLSPNTGSTAGGTLVTITGAGFVPGTTTVNFGANAAPTVSCASATTCTTTSPAGTAGTVDVTATTAGGTSPASAASKFTYQGATVTLAPTNLAFPDQTVA